MSSSSSSNAAGWTPIPPCGCGCQHYRAIKMEWKAHPLNSWTKFKIYTAKTAVSAPTMGITFNCTPAAEHHAVLVYFVCGKCGEAYRCTYDFSDEGKKSRWGYYRRFDKVIADTKLHISYEKVENVIFRDMWKVYHALHANCHHWARDFYHCVDHKSKEEFLNSRRAAIDDWDTFRQLLGI
ncbi:hypothetical protein GPALN_007807 [Globodera pallida]|nr:hypothetical protein GPALN_007807 [Globodera pallida]